jgi:response regulator of citrate/malate metabolism
LKAAKTDEPKAGVPFQFDEETLDKVTKASPQQPWPKDTHKEVAAKLNLSINITRYYIQELIRRVYLSQKLMVFCPHL